MLQAVLTERAPGVVGVLPTVNINAHPGSKLAISKCNKKAYFKSMCHTKGVKVMDVRDSKAFMGVIQQSDTSNPWSITLLVNGTPVDFIIDTGADVRVIPQHPSKHSTLCSSITHGVTQQSQQQEHGGEGTVQCISQVQGPS